MKRKAVKKNIIIFAIITLCFSLFPPQVFTSRTVLASGEQETLLNPSFESELVNGEIPGWSVDEATAAYGSISLSSDYARTGSNSLLFEDTTAGSKPVGHFRVLSNPITVSEGDTVTFSTYVYKAADVDQSHGIQPVIHFYNEAGTEVTLNSFVNYGKTAVPVGEWFEIAVSAVVPEGTAFIKVGLYSGFPSLTKVYMDDAEVTITPVNTEPDPTIPTELLNPGFEAELDNGEIPGWMLDSATVGQLELNSDIYLSGSKSLYFKDSSTESSLRALSNKVAVTVGDTLVVEANAYVLQQTHNVVSQIVYYNANDEQVGSNEALFSSVSLGSNKWSAMRLLSVVPENAVYARVGLYSGIPSLTEVYFDDVSITVLPPEEPLDREYDTPVDLGKMVYVNLGQAGAIQTNTNGENEVYFVTNGNPGTFFVLDGETGEVKFQEDVPNTIATWAMTIGTDKNVYFSGTEDGLLYRYLPVEMELENLGYNTTDNWTWDLEAIDDKIYGATFNNSTHGKVYEYDVTNDTFRNYGTVEPGQQYVRGIAVDENYIYAGLGTTIRLYKIDRITGEKSEINIPGYSGNTGTIADVFVHNGKLFISVSVINMVVMDLETGEVDANFQYSNMISEPSPNDPNVVYYKYLKKFYKYDMSTKQSTEIVLPYLLPDTTRVKDIAWIEMKSGEKAGKTILAMVTQYGEYMLIDPEDPWVSFVELDIDAQPVNIQSLKKGFDGRLYMGGYQRGMSVYNPFTNQIDANISSFAQPEGIGFLNDNVYYGTYVSAIMYQYDPTKPIVTNQNPELVYDIEQQDRPFAITSGDNKLFVGTVPEYGYLGGALAIYDEVSDSWKQYDHEQLVRNQSIIGLAYKDGMLYGSTSVWGGLGIDPSEPEAKIFVWDVEKEQKVDEFTLEGLLIDEKPRMIGSIAFGPDGLLWGIVDGTIFALDVETKEVVKSKMIAPSMYNTSKWLPYELEWAPDGTIYTTLARKVVAIDPETLRYKILVDSFVNLMTLGIDGSIYYAPNAGSNLSRIAVPQTDATLSSLTVNGQLVEGFSPGVLNYTQEVTSSATIEAVPTQNGATVTVEDLRASQQKVLVHVIGIDGKSTLVYTIHTISGEPDDSDSEEPSPRPSNPNNSSADVNNDTQVITAQDLVVNEQGRVELSIKDGATKIKLPVQVDKLAKDNPIVLKSNKLSIELNPETLKELGLLVTEEEWMRSNIVISLDPVKDSTSQSLLEAASKKRNANIRDISRLYSYQLSIEKNDGTVVKSNAELNVSFKLSDDVDSELAGVYKLAEDGTLTYVGGVVEGNSITSIIQGEGTYAALEYKKTFDDVSETHWAYDTIRKMSMRLIAEGVSATEFAPEREVTRAEFIALITRAFGMKAGSGDTSFDDVEEGKWYTSAIAAAVEAGIVNGKSETEFAPNDSITREEMAVILVRVYAYKDGSVNSSTQESTFNDQDKISSWAQDAVKAAYEMGLVNGRGNQQFVPQGELTRAEAIKAIFNLF